MLSTRRAASPRTARSPDCTSLPARHGTAKRASPRPRVVRFGENGATTRACVSDLSRADTHRTATAISPLMRPTPSLATLLHRLRAWRPGRYARASSALLGWLLARAAAQALLVVLLARTLGAAAYGEFVAAIALAGFFTPLAGLGLQGVILRDGARTPEAVGNLLGAALRLYWRALLVSWAIGLTVALLALPRAIPAFALALLFGAEIAAASLVEMLARVEQARHHSAGFGATMTGLALARLAAFALWPLIGKHGLTAWVEAYAAVSMLYAVTIAWFAYRRLRPARTTGLDWAMAAQGKPFMFGAMALRVQGEFNKPVLAAIGPALTANMSLAQRAVELASLPLVALQEALWSRIYASTEPHRRLRRTGGLLLALALLCGGTLSLAAPLLPWLLGPGYASTARTLRLLAWLPALQLLRNLGNAHLVATGHAQRLTGVYVVGALAGMLTTLVLVGRYGLVGAVAAAYVTELVNILAQFVLRQAVLEHADRPLS